MKRPCMPIALASLALALAGCAAGGSSAPATGPTPLGPAEPIPPELLPALEALESAVRDGEEEVARGILASLYARRPEGRALALAEGFERILDGRELARALELELVAEELLAPRGTYVISLVARHPLAEPVVVRPSAARLVQLVTSVDPRGAEQHRSASRAVEGLARLELPPGEGVRVDLVELDLPPVPGALALRAQVRLALLPGTVELGGRELPAQELEVAPVECLRLASVLPTAPVEPAELLRYVLEERVRRPALMERAVRIAPARRGEALDLVAAAVDRLSAVDCEELVPALRWLSADGAPGGDPRAWREWLVARADSRAGARQAAAARLSVPEPRSSAARGATDSEP